MYPFIWFNRFEGELIGKGSMVWKASHELQKASTLNIERLPLPSFVARLNFVSQLPVSDSVSDSVSSPAFSVHEVRNIEVVGHDTNHNMVYFV